MPKPHRFADVFPSLDPDQFKALVTSIRDHGLRQPLVLFEGQILDGRNRYKACDEAAVKPEYETFEGTGQEALATHRF